MGMTEHAGRGRGQARGSLPGKCVEPSWEKALGVRLRAKETRGMGLHHYGLERDGGAGPRVNKKSKKVKSVYRLQCLGERVG
jgi:hypothetical protein